MFPNEINVVDNLIAKAFFFIHKASGVNFC